MGVEIIGIIGLSGLLYYWSQAKQNQEVAYQAARQHCRMLGLQMLDDYVALQHLQLQRQPNGKLNWRRTYQFEFSATGAERYQGNIILLGSRIQSIQLDPYRINSDNDLA